MKKTVLIITISLLVNYSANAQDLLGKLKALQPSRGGNYFTFIKK